MNENHFYSVRHLATARNSTCPLTGQPVGAAAGQTGFAIYRGRQLLSAEAARQAPADLHRFLEAINAGPPIAPGEAAYGIVDSASAPNTQCGRDGLGTPAARRGQWEISYVAPGSEAKLLGLLAGQELAPTLAAVLHEHYGSAPVERPKPVRPEDQQRQKRERAAAARERARTDREAMRKRDLEEAADLIAKMLESDAPAKQRARDLIEALCGVFALAD